MFWRDGYLGSITDPQDAIQMSWIPNSKTTKTNKIRHEGSRQGNDANTVDPTKNFAEEFENMTPF